MAEIKIEHGDSRDILKSVADNSIDSCVTDPPYSLVSIQKRFGKPGQAPAQFGKDGLYQRASSGFMGQQWDTGATAHDPAFWAEVLRVLKPGGHIAAFAGTRTYHRLACAIEDAGFEIRDQIGWLFGSGFPKSHDVSKGIDKAAGAKREVVGVKVNTYDGARRDPSKHGNPADQSNIGKWGLTQTPHGMPLTAPATDAARQWQGWGTALKPAWEPIVLARKPLDGTVAANVLAHGTGALNIDACRISVSTTDARDVGRKITRHTRVKYDGYGMNRTGDQTAVTVVKPEGRWPANFAHDGSDEVINSFPISNGALGAVRGTEKPKAGTAVYGDYGPRPAAEPRGDVGSAARFFYSAKADAEDRWGSKHPTVKPVALMRWLVRLITPTGGCVLDPFAGTGTTGVACLAEGFGCILIERESAYLEDIRERIAFYRGEGKHSLQSLGRHVDQTKATGSDLPLFKPEKSGEAV